jgi:peptidoglycan/xylan/chitin deacetylase (PgdA/CDA1 family)
VTFASLSLDLDNEWSYLKTHGNPAWESFPSYFDIAVPRILEFLAARKLTITFFVVGKDATLPGNVAALQAIARAKHEIASHSYMHDPWLQLYKDDDLVEDLRLAEEAIFAVTGTRPEGFRGPGFSLSGPTLEILRARGYRYDATVFPNLLNPLARAYFFASSNLSAEEREQRKALFGTWKDALRPVKPFRWRLAAGELLELPVTTMPFIRVPMHLSYLLYLGKYSRLAARAYFRLALAACSVGNVQPSILLHPLDFLGREDCPSLRFFPGMDLPIDRKLAAVDELMDLLVRRFEIVTMREHANRAARGWDALPSLLPAFSQ